MIDLPCTFFMIAFVESCFVYEDKYQIAAKVDGFLQIEELQPSWAPEQN